MKYLLVLVIAMIATCNTMAFTSPSSSFVGNGMKYSQNPARQNRGSGSSLQMFFGQPKDDGSPGDYVCKVIVFWLSNAKHFRKDFVQHSIRRELQCLSSWFFQYDVNSLTSRYLSLNYRIVAMSSQKDPRHGLNFQIITDAHHVVHQREGLTRYPRDLQGKTERFISKWI